MDTNTKNKPNEVVFLKLQSLMQKELSAIKSDILSEVTSIRKHVTKAGERDSSLVKALNLERQRLTTDLNEHYNITKDKIDAAVEQIKDLSKDSANATWCPKAGSVLLIVNVIQVLLLAIFMLHVHSSIRENQEELNKQLADNKELLQQQKSMIEFVRTKLYELQLDVRDLADSKEIIHALMKLNEKENELLQKMSQILATQESLKENRRELLEIIKTLEQVKHDMKNFQRSHESMSHEIAVRNQEGLFDLIERLLKKLASYI